MGKKGSDNKQRSMRFPQWMDMALEELSASKGMTVTEIVVKYVEQGLAKNGYTAGIGDDFDTLADASTKKILAPEAIARS